MFVSIQGEGLYSGQKVLFIRLSGCNLTCLWCDTIYHNEINYKLSPYELSEKIFKMCSDDGSNVKYIVWTGGEPLLQGALIKNVLMYLNNRDLVFIHHLETNGTIINNTLDLFSYISFSPKDIYDLNNVIIEVKDTQYQYDIKVVTDLNVIGLELLKNATIIMPLTTGDSSKDKLISQLVWEYCVKNNKKFGMRLHSYIWGQEREK